MNTAIDAKGHLGANIHGLERVNEKVSKCVVYVRQQAKKSQLKLCVL